MIAWLDLETTGLDPRKDSILELALVLTDDDLNELGRFVSLVRPLHLRGVEIMDEYVKRMHRDSGLIDEIYEEHIFDPITEDRTWRERDGLRRCGEVEADLVTWLHAEAAGMNAGPMGTGTAKYLRGVPLGGNSVHFDRAFIREHMPDLERLFSHRHVDVSTITELTKRWVPPVHAGRPGVRTDGTVEPKHRALDDVLTSIETAKYYREHLFQAADPRWVEPSRD